MIKNEAYVYQMLVTKLEGSELIMIDFRLKVPCQKFWVYQLQTNAKMHD